MRMREIQMVDLVEQYRKYGTEIDSAIKSVLQSAAFIKGPEVGRFEEELQRYMGCRHVISCANGTDALQIAMMALGLKPGDEVITTNFTFIATVEVVALLGLRLVLVDPDPDTFNISVDAIKNAITPRTRAIVPVHLFGQCADMEQIMKLAKDNNLNVVEDTAQATGSEYIFSDGSRKKAGTIGTIGTTSFFPSKNLGCSGDGGALFTDDAELAAMLKSISNHGMKERYHYDHIGVNSRLDTIQAAILLLKLKYLDRFNEARRKAADIYDEAYRTCPHIKIPERSSSSVHIFHQYTIRVKNGKRDELRKYLSSEGIPSMIYYPGPLHLQKAYRNLGYTEDDFPVTSMLCREVLSLPMHPELETEQLEHITRTVLNFFENI
ncbi:MAG TPA: DegT/DnrJ/EryC1/StrS family aminotransferase [Bacteroidales bacterium]|nr:DegT/DnrJ/EryC1/StrS family aminotransferase [Bacteroidales bacterium]HPF02936.1 DegT/DnrJ/EryC1/StrS family aminotransferase [Bacteroidales bacterium]HPJ59206.1 DegT/DnrJ/EryC1/StrS family aminotransferase [Bacteroidales bacterium]HPR11829.1 DegT/DnrJ/EryC1/StrS family aminotransferase [Bacteroidales bacterium]HRW84022.1 DegT/DnrJ/EryC1/StrS family aminotransferase [Bacteroidales bacterium]